ncbi:tripartite tricarboxylate transporter TctB family protein [Marinomonas sp. 2405UD68-3]|uniref:tripartite tricarboxylate transporter TctB family protein n=1 Tax=Marinomonas sp. 2405UD68-3 TaxID=3391835 RepID=UPI0039C9844E
MNNYILKLIPWACFLALGIVAAWQASQINSISFDPLGSKAAPYAFSGLLIFLLLLDLIRNGFRANKDDTNHSITEIISVISVLSMSILYCLSIFLFDVPFSISTIFLVPIVSWILQPVMSKKTVLTRFIFGTCLGVGGELLFTKVFFVDLPTIW